MRTLISMACLALLSACSIHEEQEAVSFPEEAADSDAAVTFSLRGEGSSAVAQINAAGIVSADLNVARFREDGGVALRGVAHGRPVNVDAKGGEVAGLIGGQPVNLAVSRDDGALLVSGLSRGQLTSFRMDAATVEGKIGGCSYELSRVESETVRYEGRRSCGGPSEHVVLKMPESLSQWRDAESAAALAMLMGDKS